MLIINDREWKQIGFQFLSPFPLLRLHGLGWHTITNPNYFWNSRTRLDVGHCILQYTLKGKGNVEIDGVNYDVLENEGFLISVPGEYSYSLPRDSNLWEVLYFEFSMDALPFIEQLKKLSGNNHFRLNENSVFIKLAWEVYNSSVNDQIDNVYQCSKLAYNLLFELFNSLIEDSATKKLPPKIKKARQFIEDNYKLNISIDNISDYVKLSKFHLTREFEKEFGIAPGKYLINIRLEKAIYLLLTEPNLNVNEIAESTGFSCGNYFSKVFKNKFNTTPTEYRKNNSCYSMYKFMYEK